MLCWVLCLRRGGKVKFSGFRDVRTLVALSRWSPVSFFVVLWGAKRVWSVYVLFSCPTPFSCLRAVKGRGRRKAGSMLATLNICQGDNHGTVRFLFVLRTV